MEDQEEVENARIIFKNYIDRLPQESDFEYDDESTIKLKVPHGSGALLVKNLYLSCESNMRGRMQDFHGSHNPPFTPGSVITHCPLLCLLIDLQNKTAYKVTMTLQPIEGYGVFRIVDSDHPDFKRGDVAVGVTRWEEYSLLENTRQIRKIERQDSPLSYHLGLLGMAGFTAYAGFYQVCSPKEGDYFFVSAASGPVGQLVGQLAKLHGCYVVGSTSSNKKVDLLKKALGFDEAFNYNEEPDLEAALKRYFPEGIDVYFDSVGGSMLDAALANMRVHGRIAACGMVSQNSMSRSEGIYNLMSLVLKRVRVHGFLVTDHLHLFPKFLEHIITLYKEGKIAYIEDIRHGLESAPSAFVSLFIGENLGKVVISLEDDP
ncbi:hypothetical protein QQ045_003641 [Rhodiola kirilowii]